MNYEFMRENQLNTCVYRKKDVILQRKLVFRGLK